METLAAPATLKEDLAPLLAVQQAAFAAAPSPSRQERIRNLDLLHNLLIENEAAFVEALNADFGTRAPMETVFGELAPSLEAIAYYRRNLRAFMRPSRRAVPLTLLPARARIHYQPLGVIGMVVPWNFPLLLAIPPLVTALAAGNRVMIKMSEAAPQTGALLKRLLADIYPADLVAVVLGEADVAAAFSALPFDHLLFTGSTQVGRAVMAAAARNLTPVTLELGGKSPVLIHEAYPIDKAAKRIAFGKTFSGGQACIAPDYVLCPADKVAQFCTAMAGEVAAGFKNLADNPDYTAVINSQHLARIQGLLDEAVAKGATAHPLNPAHDEMAGSGKMPLTLLTGVSDEMGVMQQEIFGPLLPIVPYTTMAEALAYINARPRPLSLMYFDTSNARGNSVAAATHSGGFCQNDTLSSILPHDLPYGGVGPSGLGRVHGREGFIAFSNPRGVIKKGWLDSRMIFAKPPRTGWAYRALQLFHKLKYRPRRIPVAQED